MNISDLASPKGVKLTNKLQVWLEARRQELTLINYRAFAGKAVLDETWQLFIFAMSLDKYKDQIENNFPKLSNWKQADIAAALDGNQPIKEIDKGLTDEDVRQLLERYANDAVREMAQTVDDNRLNFSTDVKNFHLDNGDY